MDTYDLEPVSLKQQQTAFSSRSYGCVHNSPSVQHSINSLQMCHLEAVISKKEIPIPSYPIICCTKRMHLTTSIQYKLHESKREISHENKRLLHWINWIVSIDQFHYDFSLRQISSRVHVSVTHNNFNQEIVGVWNFNFNICYFL